MLFLAKRRPAGAEQRSGKETCLSILGLLLAFVLIGGLAALIYGLVVHNASATITGAIVFGVGVCLTVLLVLLIVFCLKQNPTTGNHQHRPHRQEMSHVQVSHAFSPSNVYPNLGDVGPSPSKTPGFSALNQSHSSATSRSLRDNRFD